MRRFLSHAAPRVLPSLAFMLADLGQPCALDLAALLDVHPRTVARWMRAGHAPRAAALALFWMTRWGRSQIDAHAVNDARLAHALARSAGDALAASRRENAHLQSVGDFGSANAAVF